MNQTILSLTNRYNNSLLDHADRQEKTLSHLLCY